MNTDGIWIVGPGAMGVAHAVTLRHLGHDPVVIGRGADSAAKFQSETGIAVQQGGLAAWLATVPAPAIAAIVAVDAGDLEPVAVALMQAGVRRLLIEKPAGVDPASIGRVAAAATRHAATVYVAYNRRFFASVIEARRLIAEDGGVTSFSFEFTELASHVGSLPHPDAVKANWFLANSTHVVDLAFDLGGAPAEMSCLVQGGLDWHPTARFAGCGRSVAGALFHYGADWTSAGRWGIEINTPRRRLILRPMETLQIQEAGQFGIVDAGIDDQADKGFKPGFLRQMQAFLGDAGRVHLIDIQQHADRVQAEYAAMLSGGIYQRDKRDGR